jgi:hypothetical protein
MKIAQNPTQVLQVTHERMDYTDVSEMLAREKY